MSTEAENPRKWRYTWEAQAHLPVLKLFLFNPHINPQTHCNNLKSQLILQKSLVKTSWFEAEAETSLSVPIPRVLIDGEAPIQYKALYDYIEVKIVLLLPVDHPIFVEFDSRVSLYEKESSCGNVSVDSSRLSIDTGFESLSSDLEGVQFYCRSCSAQLTKTIKSFAEMPSTNWSEVADNWFGGCCCSFGGISDKLVAKYANSYASAEGTCLLGTTFVVLFKDDLVDCDFPYVDGSKETDLIKAQSLGKVMLKNGAMHESVRSDSKQAKVAANLECHIRYPTNGDYVCKMPTESELSNDVLSASKCCSDGEHNLTCETENGCFETSQTCLEDQPLIKTFELPENKKSFLNGFLGDIFMARSSNLSKDVSWVEFLCPQCSSFLGAYPTDNGCTVLDGGIRLFKCYISTSLPTSRSDDLFRKYTLERMFTNQLVENAKTELSYRTVIRDLLTKSVMLQVVLLNPNSFLQSSYCSGKENKFEALEKADLSSAVKVLFADCRVNGVSRIRMVEEWTTKNKADEVYMFALQIEELIKILDSRKDMFPLSCTSLQGLSLSSMRR